MDAASRVYQGCGPLAPADQPPILAPSCLRLAFSVRISGKFAANHATFPPHDNSAISMAYNLRTKSAKSIGSERIGPRRANFGLFPPWPVNRSAPKTPGILPKSGRIGRAESGVHFETGGWSGIRTHDTLLTYTHFPGARLRPLGHPSRPRHVRQRGTTVSRFPLYATHHQSMSSPEGSFSEFSDGISRNPIAAAPCRTIPRSPEARLHT